MHKHMAAEMGKLGQIRVIKPKTGQMVVPGELWFCPGQWGHVVKNRDCAGKSGTDGQLSYRALLFFVCVDRQLVKACVLTVRDVNSWWLSIPCAGVFVKTLTCGRRALEAIFRRCKYREILRSVR